MDLLEKMFLIGCAFVAGGATVIVLQYFNKK